MDDSTVRMLYRASTIALQRFIENTRNPPPSTQIKKFEVRETKPRPKIKEFRIRYDLLQEELQEGFRAMLLIFMHYWIGFRDYRNEFRGFSKNINETFKVIMEKYGEILNKLTVIFFQYASFRYFSLNLYA